MNAHEGSEQGEVDPEVAASADAVHDAGQLDRGHHQDQREFGQDRRERGQDRREHRQDQREQAIDVRERNVVAQEKAADQREIDAEVAWPDSDRTQP